MGGQTIMGPEGYHNSGLTFIWEYLKFQVILY